MRRDAELVVLVHGMGRTSMSMLPLAYTLRRAGYRVLNFGYSSYGPTVAAIGAALGRALEARLRGRPAPRVHFVGHSLGNIVVRWLLAHAPPSAPVGRFVMLAPPNRGARAADRLAPWLGWLLRPLPELRTGAGTAADLPPPAGVEFAIVAGTRDGKVRPEETRLPGAKAQAVVPAGHTFIAMNPVVVAMVRRFLAEGSLEAAPSAPEQP